MLVLASEFFFGVLVAPTKKNLASLVFFYNLINNMIHTLNEKYFFIFVEALIIFFLFFLDIIENKKKTGLPQGFLFFAYFTKFIKNRK